MPLIACLSQLKLHSKILSSYNLLYKYNKMNALKFVHVIIQNNRLLTN